MDDPAGESVLSLAASAVSAPYWRALAGGHLELPFCSVCDRPFFYPRRFCPSCWSEDIEWREVERGGSVYALTEVHLAFQGIDSSELPYRAVLVDLDAGVRIPGRLDASASAVRIGDRVVLRFGPTPEKTLPTFWPEP